MFELQFENQTKKSKKISTWNETSLPNSAKSSVTAGLGSKWSARGSQAHWCLVFWRPIYFGRRDLSLFVSRDLTVQKPNASKQKPPLSSSKRNLDNLFIHSPEKVKII